MEENIISKHKHHDGKPGGATWDRKEIYEWLYKNSDNRGFIVMNQRQIAEKLGMTNSVLCKIYSDLLAIGYLKKYGTARDAIFEVVHHPEDLDWGQAFMDKQSELRKTHQWSYKKKEKE